MGNCFKSCSFYPKEKKNVTLVIVGLDNSGKTTMAKKLAGEPVVSVLKTLGFSLIVLHYHGYRISLYDLGGSPQIRDIWSKYFMDAHGVIFVVDASDTMRIAEAKSIFMNVLSHENVSEKPVLLLANKQDKENVLDELEIIEQLDVEYIVNKYRCLTRVEICSALGNENGKLDPSIKSGFRWLVDNIIQNHNVLDRRVQRDMTDFAILVQKDKEEWKSRVEANSEMEYRENPDLKNGNPFQPIDQIVTRTNCQLIDKDDGSYSSYNGAMMKPVLVNNYVKSEKTSHQNCINQISGFPLKTEIKEDQNLVVNVAEKAIKAKKSKLNQQYHKHKKKFSHFNKTAPMPIDAIIRDECSNKKSFRETSKYSVKSNLTDSVQNGSEKHCTNYLSKRPATAPSRFHFSTVKVNTSWNMITPQEISASSTSKVFFVRNKNTDEEDVISFF